MADHRNYNPQRGDDAPLPNGMGAPHFSSDAYAQNATGQFAASQTIMPDIQESEKGIKKYSLIGAGYTLYGAIEIGGYELVASGLGAALIGAIYVFVIAGIPSACLYFRKGIFSAGILCGVTTLNMITVGVGWLSGNPDYGFSSVLFNAAFLAAFIRAFTLAWKLRQIRKAEGRA